MLKIRLKRIGLILKPTKECKQLRLMMIMRIHFMQMSINSLRLLNQRLRVTESRIKSIPSYRLPRTVLRTRDKLSRSINRWMKLKQLQRQSVSLKKTGWNLRPIKGAKLQKLKIMIKRIDRTLRLTRSSQVLKMQLRSTDLTMRLITDSKLLRTQLKRIGSSLKQTNEYKQLKMKMIKMS